MPLNLTPSGYALLGLTAIVASLAAVVTFAVLRFIVAARSVGRASHVNGPEGSLMSGALEEAIARLRAQERATAARAEASERLMGEIISSLTAGLMVVGLEGEIRILNPAGRRILGWGDHDLSAPPSARQMPLLDVVAECLSRGQAILRRAVRLPDIGRGVDLGVTVSPLLDGEQQAHGAICLFTDLTSVKDLEERLRMKESLATVGELTAGIAHEFRNGLATIQGYSKLVDLNALPDSYRPYIEGIRAETVSLSQVVTNFLNFARPAQLTLTRVDLAVLCARAVEDIRTDVRALGGDVELQGEFCDVEGDDVLLRQAFSNLLRNAVEACRDAHVVPRITVEASLDPERPLIRVAVNDNGPGIEPSSRERVFQPFFTSKRNGTGLGLALVHKIIVFHNGRVVVATSAQGGASLRVTLPSLQD